MEKNELDRNLPGAVLCNQKDRQVNDTYWLKNYKDGLDIPFTGTESIGLLGELINQLEKLKEKHGADANFQIIGDSYSEDTAIIICKD